MNIDQAKLIPLVEILEKLGRSPSKQKPHEQWYLSPFRNEKTASFHVSVPKNVWYDHGEGMGGDGIALVCHHLKQSCVSHTVSDALRWLNNMTGYISKIGDVPSVDYSLLDKKLELVNKKKIEHPALIQYLESRGIPFKIANACLFEIRVLNKESKKQFFALGLPNEEGGFEYRNQFLKGCVGDKSISFIRGTKPKPDSLHIFEGFFDYLSVIAKQDGQRFEGDTIILNSVACSKLATPYISNYGYEVANTWLDNDKAGIKANQAFSEYFKEQGEIVHKPMNKLYLSHKDVNTFHMKKLGL